MSNWRVFNIGHQSIHVVPTNDTHQHLLVDCPCKPTIEEHKKTLYIHHSFDGREAVEEARKILSLD